MVGSNQNLLQVVDQNIALMAPRLMQIVCWLNCDQHFRAGDRMAQESAKRSEQLLALRLPQ